MTENRNAILAATLLIVSVLLPSQWLNDPTLGLPKKTDSARNLDAPTRMGRQ